MSIHFEKYFMNNEIFFTLPSFDIFAQLCGAKILAGHYTFFTSIHFIIFRSFRPTFSSLPV